MLNLPVIKTSIIVGNDRKLEIDSNVFVKGYIRAKSLFIDGQEIDDYITDKNIESSLARDVYTWVVYAHISDDNNYTNISTELNIHDDSLDESELHNYIGISYNKLTKSPSLNANDVYLYTWIKLPSDGSVILDINQTFFLFPMVGGGSIEPATYSYGVAKFMLISSNGLLKYNKINFNANNFEERVDTINKNTTYYTNNNESFDNNEFIVSEITANGIKINNNKLYNYDGKYETITTGIPGNFNDDSASIIFAIKYKYNDNIYENSFTLSYLKSTIAPGVLYRGDFKLGTKYYSSQQRRDIVYFKVENVANYWIASNFAKNGKDNWDVPGVPWSSDWTKFGAEFSSIATGIIISEESYIKNTVNIGTDFENPFITLYAGGLKDVDKNNEVAYISVNQKSVLYNESIDENKHKYWKQYWGYPGIYIGTYTKQYIDGIEVNATAAPSLSLVGANVDFSNTTDGLFKQGQIANNNALLWDSENLIIIGKMAHFDTPKDYIESEYYNEGGKQPGWIATLNDIDKSIAFRVELDSSVGTILKDDNEETILTAYVYRGIGDGENSDTTQSAIEGGAIFNWYKKFRDNSLEKIVDTLEYNTNSANDLKYFRDFDGITLLKKNQIKISNNDIDNKIVIECNVDDLSDDMYPIVN